MILSPTGDQGRILVYCGARCVGDRARAAWSSDRRRAYLLRDDVDLPWSLDPRVWPVAASTDPKSDIRKISAVFTGTERRSTAWRGDRIFDGLPDAPLWLLVGYDICDSSGTSGLTNCGYDLVERESIQKHWAGRLSDRHLFCKVEDAEEFCDLTDLRAPEHAPFFVIEIWVAVENV